MRSWRDAWKVHLPEGTSGAWKIEHFEVDKKAASFGTVRAIASGTGRSVPEGRYTGLYRGQSLIMSDTPDEMRDHVFPYDEARRRGGHVLINGLGLGMVTAAILNAELQCESCMQYPWNGECDCTQQLEEAGLQSKPHVAGDRYAVDKVTVIEKSADVIALVGPALTGRFGARLEIIEADAFEFKPPKGQRFSVVWHDMWDNLCTDNLEGMGTLHRKYGHRCDWQGSWGREILQRYRRQERNQGW